MFSLDFVLKDKIPVLGLDILSSWPEWWSLALMVVTQVLGVDGGPWPQVFGLDGGPWH